MKITDDLRTLYRQFSQAGGVFDVSNRTRIRVRGRDRVRVLNNLCTARLADLEPGQGAEAFVLDVKGHIVGHVAIYLAPDELWLETVADQADALIQHIDSYVISESIQFENRTQETAAYLCCGAAAEMLIQSADLQLGARLTHGPLVTCSSCWVCQTDLIGPPGVLLIFATEEAESVHNAFSCLQSNSRLPDELLEVLCIEHGCPAFGRDITPKNLPQEINRDDLAISFTKGCYLGQETVARLDALGHVNRKLVRLQFESNQVPPPEFRIERDGKAIGRVTSAILSPSDNRALALAFMRSGFDSPGTAVDTDLGPAQVLPLLSREPSA